MNCMSRRSATPSGRVRRRKPLLLRMLFENLVAQRVEWIRKCAPLASSAGSITTAVQTSPKMKWQSRSRHSRWPEQISGLTTMARRAQPLLYLDGNRRIGPLVVRGGADDQVDLRPLAPRLRQCLATGIKRHFRHDPRLVITALTQKRMHHLRIKHATLVHHMPPLDPRCVVNELRRGQALGLHLTRRDGIGMGHVEPLGIGVESLDQFLVGDHLCGREHTRSRYRGLTHVALLKVPARSPQGTPKVKRNVAQNRATRVSSWQKYPKIQGLRLSSQGLAGFLRRKTRAGSPPPSVPWPRARPARRCPDAAATSRSPWLLARPAPPARARRHRARRPRCARLSTPQSAPPHPPHQIGRASPDAPSASLPPAPRH